MQTDDYEETLQDIKQAWTIPVSHNSLEASRPTQDVALISGLSCGAEVYPRNQFVNQTPRYSDKY